MDKLRPTSFSLKYLICAILSVILPFHFLGNALPAILLLASIAMVFVTLSVLNSNCDYVPGIAYAGILSTFWLMTGIILLLMGAMDLVPEIEDILFEWDLIRLLGLFAAAPLLYTFYLEYRKLMWI